MSTLQVLSSSQAYRVAVEAAVFNMSAPVLLVELVESQLIEYRLAESGLAEFLSLTTEMFRFVEKYDAHKHSHTHTQ